MLIKVRAAEIADYKIINQYDEFAGDRRIEMERGELFVADIDGIKAVGFLVITSNEFFNKPLISLVNVVPDFRQKGVAKVLIEFAIKRSGWIKLYAATEASNDIMHTLFPKVGFELVGEIMDFNFDGEAEKIYCYSKS